VNEAWWSRKLCETKWGKPHHVDVWELFSGASLISKRAVDFKMTAGEPAEFLFGWDLRRPEVREHARRYREKVRPKLIVAGLECTHWCWYNV
jgi:hypothetical protein